MTPKEATEKVIACCSLGDYVAYTPVIEPIIQQCVDDATAELRAVVDRLPKCADGAICYPNRAVWAVFRDGIFRGVIANIRPAVNRVGVLFDDPIWLTDETYVHLTDPLTICLYSTREAAEATKESKAEAKDG